MGVVELHIQSLHPSSGRLCHRPQTLDRLFAALSNTFEFLGKFEQLSCCNSQFVLGSLEFGAHFLELVVIARALFAVGLFCCGSSSLLRFGEGGFERGDLALELLRLLVSLCRLQPVAMFGLVS